MTPFAKFTFILVSVALAILFGLIAAYLSFRYLHFNDFNQGVTGGFVLGKIQHDLYAWFKRLHEPTTNN